MFHFRVTGTGSTGTIKKQQQQQHMTGLNCPYAGHYFISLAPSVKSVSSKLALICFIIRLLCLSGAYWPPCIHWHPPWLMDPHSHNNRTWAKGQGATAAINHSISSVSDMLRSGFHEVISLFNQVHVQYSVHAQYTGRGLRNTNTVMTPPRSLN